MRRARCYIDMSEIVITRQNKTVLSSY